VRRPVTCCLAALVGLFADHAAADPGVDLRSFRPSTDRSGSLATEDVDTPGHGKLQFAQWVGFATTQLEVREPGADGRARVLGPQLLLDPTVAIGLGARTALGLTLPFVAAQSTNPSPTLTDGATVPSQAIGDLTLTGKVAILAPNATESQSRFGLATLVRFSFPTGDRSSFVSDSGVVAEARVLMLYELARSIGIFGSLGYRLRMSHHDLADATVGDSIPWGATFAFHPQWLGIDKDRKWTWMLEAHGEVGTSGFFTDARVSPALAGASIRYAFDPSWSIFVGVETGLSRALGTPRLRGVFSLSYAPSFVDEDRDGVPDDRDECVGLEEDGLGKKPHDGCPDIPDDEPQKDPDPPPKDPEPPAVPATPPDTDGDGIPDDVDKCPDQPENFNGFEDEDGCPELDKDGDTILDAVDKCPDEPETWNGFEDEDGCPDTPPLKKGEKPPKPLVVETKAKDGTVTLGWSRPIVFEGNALAAASMADLRAAAAWLLAHPGQRLRVTVRPEPVTKALDATAVEAQATARTKSVVDLLIKLAHNGGVAVAAPWPPSPEPKDKKLLLVLTPEPTPPAPAPTPPTPAPTPAPTPSPAPSPAPSSVPPVLPTPPVPPPAPPPKN